jgi:transposase
MIEPHPSELRAEALARLREGLSTREVAKQLHVSPVTVWRWGRLAGVGRRRGASVTNETSQKRGT